MCQIRTRFLQLILQMFTLSYLDNDSQTSYSLLAFPSSGDAVRFSTRGLILSLRLVAAGAAVVGVRSGAPEYCGGLYA